VSDLLTQEFYTLQDAAKVKGIKYNTLRAAKNRKYQPNWGHYDGKVCGRCVWRRETIAEWLTRTDLDIDEGGVE